MAFALNVTQPARFTSKRLDAIHAQGRTAPALPPHSTGDALARIREQLGSPRN